jgi:hypothetical protein
MELQAVLEALKALDGPLLIQTDSKYVRNIFTEWLALWKRKGILHKKENTDLILEIDGKMQGRDVKWEWVRGHNGHPLNEQADMLATSAAQRIRSPASRTISSPSGANRIPRKRQPPKPRAFPAKFAGTCGDCATRFAPGVKSS